LTQPLTSLLAIAAVGFVAAAILTPIVARLALLRGWLDHPDILRKHHPVPVPAVGGVAVYAAFALALAFLPLFGGELAGGGGWLDRSRLALGVGSLAVMLVGLVDDVRNVGPRVKLAVEFSAAAFLYWSGFRIEGLSNPFGGSIQLGVWAIPVTLFWLVGMSNAFNLLDGLDGLAAGLALVSTFGLLVAAGIQGRWETALVAAALAGALAGFLPYNFDPARVFLGDCGALPVGFVLAAVAVQSSIKASATIAVAVPLLALALPILDVGLAVVRRVVRRRPVFAGDRHHIHHRLVDLGLTPRRAVVTLYGVAVVFAVLALAMATGPRMVVWASGALVVLVVWVGVRALGYWEVTEIQRSFLARLRSGLQASGDAALRGLENDLERLDEFELAWARLCETAWSLELTELHLEARPGWETRLPERHSFAPRPWALRAPGVRGESTWRFDVEADGVAVAEVVARRPLRRLEFDPERLADLVGGLVRRHLAAARPPEVAVP